MTNTFEASFTNVEAIEDRPVSRRGEVFGLSRFKGREVKIVVLEEPSCCATVTYGAGIEGGVPTPQRDQELGTFIGNKSASENIPPVAAESITPRQSIGASLRTNYDYLAEPPEADASLPIGFVAPR